MNIEEIEIWTLLAGLGLFLFGMYMLEESLKALAGRSFKIFLRKHTGNPVKAVLSGTLVTAILQSSSMVSLLVMSFTGAGIIGLKNGIGMIMGANLGTTMTGWLVSLIGFKLDIGAAILPFLAIGGLGIIFLKSEKLSHISKLLMGFSFMFLGLNFMKNGFADFSEHIDFTFLHDKPLFLFTLVAFALTAAIQSSSAGMMIFLSSLAAGVVSMEQAFYLVVGGDLGTTVTALIGTINGNSIRKKTGWSQFFFNVFTACFALLFMPAYIYVIIRLLGITDPLIATVAFHSIFNLSGIIILLPFLNYFTRFIDKAISSKEDKKARNLMLANPLESHAAIEALEKESLQFINEALHVNRTFFRNATSTGNQNYFDLKSYESEIAAFYIPLQQTNLTAEEVSKINNLVGAVRNATLSAKGLKDIKHNLTELSNAASDNFYKLYEQICSNQLEFYDEVNEVMKNVSVSSQADLEKLNDMQQSFYRHETQDLYQIFKTGKKSELDIPSYLNMIREINNSNESILRALRYYLNHG